MNMIPGNNFLISTFRTLEVFILIVMIALYMTMRAGNHFSTSVAYSVTAKPFCTKPR